MIRVMTDVSRPLPKGWDCVKLGEHVLKIGSGQTPLGGQSSYVDKGVPFIRSQNVHMNRFVREGLAYITEEQDASMSESRVFPGDVLLNITGASIGRVCLVPSDLCPANVNQHVSIIRSDGSFDPAFLSFHLSTPVFQKFIMDSQAGATRQALTKTMIEGFSIPFPSLPEQKRIAGILNEQMAAVERARKAAEERLAAVNALPAAYLRAAFPDRDQALPKDWRWTQIRDVCELLPSRSISTDGDVEVCAVTTACLMETGFDAKGMKSARMRRQDVTECTLSAGEILLARSNTEELVGRCAMFVGEPKGAVASDLTIRLAVWPHLDSGFLARYLSLMFLNGYWRKHAGGASSSMKKITRSQVAALSIVLPPLPEQNRIAAMLNEQMAGVERARKAAKEELDTINALPAALLRRAFSGEL